MHRGYCPVLAAQQNDATVQQDIENSNQAFEYFNPH